MLAKCGGNDLILTISLPNLPAAACRTLSENSVRWVKVVLLFTSAMYHGLYVFSLCYSRASCLTRARVREYVCDGLKVMRCRRRCMQ